MCYCLLIIFKFLDGMMLYCSNGNHTLSNYTCIGEVPEREKREKESECVCVCVCVCVCMIISVSFDRDDTWKVI